MPKLNTFVAATLVATSLLSPANAGGPGYSAQGQVHPGAYAGTGYSHGQTYNHSGSQVLAGGYSHSATSSQTLPNYTMSASGVNVVSDNIVCVMAEQEIPCDSVPGLAEALRLQGLHSVADQLPAYRGPAGVDPYVAYGTTGTYGSGYATSGYVGGSYGSAQTGAVYTRTVPTQTTGAVSSSVRRYSSAGYSGSSIYAPTAPGYVAGGNYGAEVWVTPCGEVVTRQVVQTVPPCAAPRPRPRPVAPAPVSVRLGDGTVYALNGGVGNGIYGEFYGGGGTYIAGGSSYSGVMSAAASQFTFRQRTPTPKTRTPRPKNRYPRPNTRYPGHGGKGGGKR